MFLCRARYQRGNREGLTSGQMRVAVCARIALSNYTTGQRDRLRWPMASITSRYSDNKMTPATEAAVVIAANPGDGGGLAECSLV